MTALRPRLRALAALVALSLSIAPAASALCPHADAPGHETPGHGEMPSHASTPAPELPPCHEAPAPEPESEDAECASPCCAAASAPAPATPPTLELPAQALLPALVEAMDIHPAEALVAPRVPPRAPPDGAHLRTVRLRV